MPQYRPFLQVDGEAFYRTLRGSLLFWFAPAFLSHPPSTKTSKPSESLLHMLENSSTFVEMGTSASIFFYSSQCPFSWPGEPRHANVTIQGTVNGGVEKT
jgi:hypothetical protein